MKKTLSLVVCIVLFFSAYSQEPVNLFREDSTICIHISDKVVGGTILKRKATLSTMIYNMKYKTLAISWEVKWYSANEDGSYGEKLDIQGLNSYTETFTADNTTYVLPATGAIVSFDSSFVDSNNVVLGYDPNVTLMTQYEWYCHLASHTPIVIHSLLRQAGIEGFSKRD